MDFHPDRVEGRAAKDCAETVFSMISDAYAALTDRPVAQQTDPEGGDISRHGTKSSDPSSRLSYIVSVFIKSVVCFLKRVAYVLITMSPM